MAVRGQLGEIRTRLAYRGLALLPGSGAECQLCSWNGRRFATGGRCPVCRSLPRNRLIPYSLNHFEVDLRDSVVLHIAANPGERTFVERQGPRLHVRADVRPAKKFNLVADLTNLGIASQSVDLAIAWHVLEHIPADRAAVDEVARVLRPGGSFLMSVPIWPMGNPVTREDPSVRPEDREAEFGHPDHVRCCGLDYGERLKDSGLSVTELSVRNVDTNELERYGLHAGHMVWHGIRPDA